MGGGIAIQNRMHFQGEYFVDRYGAEAAKTAPPLRKILDMGIPVGLGTDGTRVSSFNPMLSLYWAVTGMTAGGLELYDDTNQLSRYEALKMATNGSAWFSSEENDKGLIRKGMYADFVILSEDYFDIPAERIKQLESVLTVVNGKIVYAADAFESYDPGIEEVIPDWSPVKFYGGFQNN